MMRALSLMVLLACAACEPMVSIGQPDSGMISDGGANDAGVTTRVVSGCPRVLLGDSSPVEYSADTATLTNLVISNRLEWAEAPDDAVEFTAPSAGDYRIEYSSSNVNLGAALMTRAACPPNGIVVSIDSYFFQSPSTRHFDQGESVTLFISAPYWASVKTGVYTLKVTRLH